MKYSEWRKQLNDIQMKIDAFDENYDYGQGFNIDEYNRQRKPLVDELMKHYSIEWETTV